MVAPPGTKSLAEAMEGAVSTLRGLAVPIGAVAAVLLILLFNPWYVIEGDIRTVLTVAFWISFIVLLIALFEDRNAPDAGDVEIEGPRFVRFLFHNRRAGLFWLPIRVFVGFAWLEAGWHKFTDPEWMQGGSALRAYWERAGRCCPTRDARRSPTSGIATSSSCCSITAPKAGSPTSSPSASWRSGWVSCSARLTGIAAFFGALMNMSFLLAGSASTNPIMFTLAVGLMLAWRVAGYYGLDRYLLPALGAPWRPGAVFRRDEPTGPSTS